MIETGVIIKIQIYTRFMETQMKNLIFTLSVDVFGV